MKHDYWVDWLRPAHAAQAAWLEHRVYPPAYCAGFRSIRRDLRNAEASGGNLSMGVFLGRRLVGFLLAFHVSERAQICKHIDVEPPQGVDLSGPGVFLNDFVVHPQHRGAGALMASRLTQVARTRDDLRSIPVDTFSTNTMTDTWSMKVRFLKRMSLELAQRVPLNIKVGGEELFWIVFRHVEPVARDEPPAASLTSRLKRRASFRHAEREFQIGAYNSVADWALLKPFWDELLRRTPAGNVFQSYDFLSTWWSLLGLKNELLIVVILCDDQPLVIAPMQIGRSKSLGRNLRCLSFIGHPSEVERNNLLLDPAAAALVDHVAHFLMSCEDSWDFTALYEQPSGSPLLKSFAQLLRAREFIVSQVPGPECAVVGIKGAWEQFLASKPRTFRKSLRRRLSKLEASGEVAMETLDADDAEQAQAALERYRTIEASSWKREAALGVGKTAGHRGFYRQIVRTFAARGNTAFHFLRVGGADAAGTFGLSWAGAFYSLHIAHDERFAEYSPGVALTTLEMKAAFDGAKFDSFDFLGGFMSNKRSWATSTTPSISLFAHRRGVNGWFFHLIHFRLRPHVRRLLVRLRLLDVTLVVSRFCRGILSH